MYPIFLYIIAILKLILTYMAPTIISACVISISYIILYFCVLRKLKFFKAIIEEFKDIPCIKNN